MKNTIAAAAIRNLTGHAGDASGNADRARLEFERGEINAAIETLEWCVKQTESAVYHARQALSAAKLLIEK